MLPMHFSLRPPQAPPRDRSPYRAVHGWVRTLAVIAAVATTVAVGAPAYASDDPGKTSIDAKADHAVNRSAVVNLTASARPMVSPNATGSGGHINGYHAVSITPPGGRRGTFNQGFRSNYSHGCGFWTCTINVSSGSSYTHWLGSSPYSASRMSLTDRVWVGGTNISVSIGASPSAGVSVSNHTVTMSSAISRNWRIAHSFYNVKFSTHVAMWGPYENSSDSATFSYRTFYDHIS